ncbi:hypothetical protein AB0H00_22250 [Nocardia sp. NPDC023852]|uniref:hypothetical protein n=1 Tax=Nocardia sp. NPDC023852 TaxID=3154697 RepID=UPI0033F15867
MTIELTMSSIEWGGNACLAVADAALWVDGAEVYQVPCLSVRLMTPRRTRRRNFSTRPPTTGWRTTVPHGMCRLSL